MSGIYNPCINTKMNGAWMGVSISSDSNIPLIMYFSTGIRCNKSKQKNVTMVFSNPIFLRFLYRYLNYYLVFIVFRGKIHCKYKSLNFIVSWKIYSIF